MHNDDHTCDPVEAFQKLVNSPELVLQAFETFPLPVEVFAPDGTCIFCNKAGFEFNGIPDADFIVGKYNLKNDPVCLEIIGQEIMDSIFRGEACFFPNFPAPIQDVVDRGLIDEKPFESATIDIHTQPVWDGETFICTICFFIIKNIYQGRAEMVIAQEYMNEYWYENFDREKIAAAAGMSPGHFSRMFKQFSGYTPQDYYQKIKIDKIKEKLLDPNLTVAQAFAECGVDSKGTYLQRFKEITGETPTEYRSKNLTP